MLRKLAFALIVAVIAAIPSAAFARGHGGGGHRGGGWGHHGGHQGHWGGHRHGGGRWGHRGGWQLANSVPGANVNELTSSRPEDLERLAGMSVLNGVAVRIEAVP